MCSLSTSAGRQGSGSRLPAEGWHTGTPKESALTTILLGQKTNPHRPVESHKNYFTGSKAPLVGPHRSSVCGEVWA